MKIWIDFINTPQVSFFLPFIRDFQAQGHTFVLTCRDSGNTVDLLDRANLPYEIIGRGAKKETWKKVLFFPLRLTQLWKYVRKERPSIAIGQSSFYLPLVARLLGIPSFYTNDNEYAKGNLLGFLFADLIYLPQAMAELDFIRRWPLRQKLAFYPSTKEAVYLSQYTSKNSISPRGQKYIFFRPEPLTAQYYNGPNYFFDDVLLQLAQKFRVMVLPRNPEQKSHYLELKRDLLEVADKPIPFSHIVANCLLFIGAGGSMNRELAVYGVPVVSIYQEELLAVDQYLINLGRIIPKSNPTATELIQIINENRSRRAGKNLLEQGKKSYEMLFNKISELQNA